MLRPHQRVGIAWLYLRGPRAAGRCHWHGKTAQAAGVLAMCRQTGELGEHNRAVIICQASAVLQWERELRRFLPRLEVAAATGSMTRQRRVQVYLAPWEILVVSDRTFSSSKNRDGDVELIRQFPVGIVIADDIDALRTHRTQTARAIKALAATATRVYDQHATPLQKRVMELHATWRCWAATRCSAMTAKFRRDFVKTGQAQLLPAGDVLPHPGPVPTSPDPDPGLPAAAGPATLWPPPAPGLPGVRPAGPPGPDRPHGAAHGGHRHRREKHRGVQVQAGPVGAAPHRVRRGRLPGGAAVRDLGGPEPAAAASATTSCAAARCGGCARAGRRSARRRRPPRSPAARRSAPGWPPWTTGQDDSAKLDRLMRMLTGDLEEEKVVAFVYFRENVEALSNRLEPPGSGMCSCGATRRTRRSVTSGCSGSPRILTAGCWWAPPRLPDPSTCRRARHLVAVDTVLEPGD